ncbi:hypothetical protein B0T24DRAFT_372528 [Lasiosphaeria ovina]|uniref:Uncharacterized protein n=1 Tax=Lasiosphaeria ovina TaxID=92902 RepID=A0AAE0K084_9PEZI|nr:hypothetical protein B0T24DRAFT_372528 [Lasiosphaeria ovina]
MAECVLRDAVMAPPSQSPAVSPSAAGSQRLTARSHDGARAFPSCCSVPAPCFEDDFQNPDLSAPSLCHPPSPLPLPWTPLAATQHRRPQIQTSPLLSTPLIVDGQSGRDCGMGVCASLPQTRRHAHSRLPSFQASRKGKNTLAKNAVAGSARVNGSASPTIVDLTELPRAPGQSRCSLKLPAHIQRARGRISRGPRHGMSTQTKAQRPFLPNTK